MGDEEVDPLAVHSGLEIGFAEGGKGEEAQGGDERLECQDLVDRCQGPREEEGCVLGEEDFDSDSEGVDEVDEEEEEETRRDVEEV